MTDEIPPIDPHLSAAAVVGEALGIFIGRRVAQDIAFTKAFAGAFSAQVREVHDAPGPDDHFAPVDPPTTEPEQPHGTYRDPQTGRYTKKA